MVIKADQARTWLNGLLYKEKNGLAYKKKKWRFNGLVYKKKKTKWLTKSRDIFQITISPFIFNVETSGLKRWTP